MAKEAIEKAAAEAAKAAALASIEREAAAYREAAYQQAEALRWRMELEAARKARFRNALISGLVCFASGLVAGIVMSK